jgi:hypothetical protein
MRIPAFLTNLHESDVECLMKAAKDTDTDKFLIIKTNAHDQYGNPLHGYVEVFTKKIDRQYTDLWNRYEFYHAWKDSDVDSEIESLTFISPKKT